VFNHRWIGTLTMSTLQLRPCRHALVMRSLALVLAWSAIGLSAADCSLSDRKALMAVIAAGPTPAWAPIIASADKALTAKPDSVMGKTGIPPSGNKHDYYSLARYAWPNPGNPTGPYITRDGKPNPVITSATYDWRTWTTLHARLDCLTHAWVLKRDARYARQAVRLLRVWFLDPATRMNPSLDYAQLIPGKQPVGGVIESWMLPHLVDDLCLLADSPDFSAKDQNGMKAWMNEYLLWLTTKPMGMQEFARDNNRGTWCDAQIAALALYVGKPAVAKQALNRAAKRLRGQIAADGSQPDEIKRTLSFHYSIYSLTAFIQCARLGERAGVDLWSEPALHRAIAYLAPYSDPAKVWPHPQIEPRKNGNFATLLAHAAAAWHQPELMKQAVQAGWNQTDAALHLALFR